MAIAQYIESVTGDEVIAGGPDESFKIQYFRNEIIGFKTPYNKDIALYIDGDRVPGTFTNFSGTYNVTLSKIVEYAGNAQASVGSTTTIKFELLEDGTSATFNVGYRMGSNLPPDDEPEERRLPYKTTGLLTVSTNVDEVDIISDSVDDVSEQLKYDPRGDTLSFEINMADTTDPGRTFSSPTLRYWAAWYRVFPADVLTNTAEDLVFEAVVPIDSTKVSFSIPIPINVRVRATLLSYGGSKAQEYRDAHIAEGRRYQSDPDSSGSLGLLDLYDKWNEFEVILINPEDRFTIASSSDTDIKFRVPAEDEFEIWVDDQLIQNLTIAPGEELLTIPLSGLQYFDDATPSLIRFRRLRDNLPDDEWSAHYVVEWTQDAITNIEQVDGDYLVPVVDPDPDVDDPTDVIDNTPVEVVDVPSTTEEANTSWLGSVKIFRSQLDIHKDNMDNVKDDFEQIAADILELKERAEDCSQGIYMHGVWNMFGRTMALQSLLDDSEKLDRVRDIMRQGLGIPNVDYSGDLDSDFDSNVPAKDIKDPNPDRAASVPKIRK